VCGPRLAIPLSVCPGKPLSLFTLVLPARWRAELRKQRTRHWGASPLEGTCGNLRCRLWAGRLPRTGRRAAKLDRDEPDNPSSPSQRPDAPEGPSSHRRVRWKLALPVIAVAVLAAVGLLDFALVYSRGNRSAGSVPSEIALERVYRATDQASFASLKGSFLFGGLVTTPDVIPPCPAPIGKSDAELGLIPYCSWVAIDGVQLAPKGLAIADLKNQMAAVRVHFNDPLAAGCQPSVRSECETAIVVESVVWTSNPNGAASPTPTVAAPTLSPNPVSIPDTGPPVIPVSADAAASMAIGQAGSTIPVTVLLTQLSTYGAEAPDGSMVAANTPVWAVRLSGSFQWPSCGPMTAIPHSCPSPATTELILIDARTGAFIEGMMPAPSPS
jgi:hypothetical protein